MKFYMKMQPYKIMNEKVIHFNYEDNSGKGKIYCDDNL